MTTISDVRAALARIDELTAKLATLKARQAAAISDLERGRHDDAAADALAILEGRSLARAKGSADAEREVAALAGAITLASDQLQEAKKAAAGMRNALSQVRQAVRTEAAAKLDAVVADAWTVFGTAVRSALEQAAAAGINRPALALATVGRDLRTGLETLFPNHEVERVAVSGIALTADALEHEALDDRLRALGTEVAERARDVPVEVPRGPSIQHEVFSPEQRDAFRAKYGYWPDQAIGRHL